MPCVLGSIPGDTTLKIRFAGAIAQLVEQRTGRANLALCPRFDSWWHHEELPLAEFFLFSI